MKGVALAVALVVVLFFAAGAEQAQQTKHEADPLSQLHSWLWPQRKGAPPPTPAPLPNDAAAPDVTGTNNVALVHPPSANSEHPVERRKPEPKPEAKPKPKPKPKVAQQGRERPASRFGEGRDFPYSCGQACQAKETYPQPFPGADGRRGGYGTKAQRPGSEHYHFAGPSGDSSSPPAGGVRRVQSPNRHVGEQFLALPRSGARDRLQTVREKTGMAWTDCFAAGRRCR
jgi:outer membrane biosynthesis protein TonB